MIGKTLGDRYEIIEKVGEGGMSYVYKAKCNKLNRFVAVKVLKEEFNNNADIVQKFKREATAIANLINPNIVNILDVDSQDSVNYIVMEYIDGKTLKQIIKENGKVSYQTAINIGLKVANALDCAHKNNVIHRDIKPQNIMVTGDGVVKVTDFGIAKSVDNATIAFTTSVMGSAHYFSPEQAKGSYVDCRTDIYSLGVVMYEMVTGRVPFDGDSPVSIAVKHLQEQPVAPKNINSTIPIGLNDFILKCMEKEPVKRYQNAKEVIVDLQKILQDPNVNLKQKEEDNGFTRVMSPVNIPSKDENDEEFDPDDDYRDNDDDYDEELSDEQKKKQKKKYIAILVIAIIAVVGGASLLGITLANVLSNKNQSVSQIKVPSLAGKSKEDAKKQLEDLGLVYSEVLEANNDVEEGKVIKTYPEEGKDVSKDSTVKVFVSSGAEKVEVPDLSRYDEKTAKSKLDDAGLKSNVSYEFSDKVNKGMVIEQSVSAGSKVAKGSNVNLIISKGPEIINSTVPSVINMTIQNAQNSINAAKLQMNAVQGKETDDKNLDGKIYEQDKPAGSTIKQGETVTVHYYKYVEKTISTGDIIGKTREQAEAWLRGHGLMIGGVENDKGDPSQTVDRVSITNAKKGDSITIHLSDPKSTPNPEGPDKPN
ncbi:Stk1 family PASTA domain-containing Ser/Thr kinase [Inconstantimicrobium porci]|nr:Stk1 family PASTA domain-containing Ser/Thr kinase [Inconstantimicrobium porci]